MKVGTAWFERARPARRVGGWSLYITGGRMFDRSTAVVRVLNGCGKRPIIRLDASTMDDVLLLQ